MNMHVTQADLQIGVPFIETQPHHCRWPIEGEGAGMICCGALRLESSPYCESHSTKAAPGHRVVRFACWGGRGPKADQRFDRGLLQGRAAREADRHATNMAASGHESPASRLQVAMRVATVTARPKPVPQTCPVSEGVIGAGAIYCPAPTATRGKTGGQAFRWRWRKPPTAHALAFWMGGLDENSMLTVRKITMRVAAAHDIDMCDLTSERRTGPIVTTRQRAMWLAFMIGTAHSGLSGQGRFFNRDHTTVLHAVRKVSQKMGLPETRCSTTRGVARWIWERGATPGAFEDAMRRRAAE